MTVQNGTIKPLVTNSQIPSTIKQTRTNEILGHGGYYRRFCQNFSVITAPLTNLLKKGLEYVWSTSFQDAFMKVKSVLTLTPVMLIPNFQKQFMLMVDASGIGAGAMLMQCDSSGIEHAICNFSHKFNQHQKSYSTIEKETLALILLLKHFDVYLNTTKYPIIVYTDHNPLVYSNKMKNHSRRWKLLLQEYDMDILHIKGKENVIADALSRCP